MCAKATKKQKEKKQRRRQATGNTSIIRTTRAIVSSTQEPSFPPLHIFLAHLILQLLPHSLPSSPLQGTIAYFCAHHLIKESESKCRATVLLWKDAFLIADCTLYSVQCGALISFSILRKQPLTAFSLYIQYRVAAIHHPYKNDKDRREGKGRRCCLGGRMYSIPRRTSYFA